MARPMSTIDKINWFYQKVLFMKLVMQVQRKSDAISRKEQNLGIKKKGGGMSLSQAKSHAVYWIKN